MPGKIVNQKRVTVLIAQLEGGKTVGVRIFDRAERIERINSLNLIARLKQGDQPVGQQQVEHDKSGKRNL